MALKDWIFRRENAAATPMEHTQRSVDEAPPRTSSAASSPEIQTGPPAPGSRVGHVEDQRPARYPRPGMTDVPNSGGGDRLRYGPQPPLPSDFGRPGSQKIKAGGR